MSPSILVARSAFGGLAIESAPGRGVIAAERAGLGIASVLGKRGRAEELAQCVRQEFGLELPRGPRRVEARGVAFVGMGVDSWLALSSRDDTRFAAAVARALERGASITDQSSNYAVLRLTGPQVRSALAKVLPIDLHPREFKVGDAAATAASHVAARLWRLEDGPEGSAVFEIAVARSYAASFWHALTAGAAEFGFVLEPDVNPG